MPHRYFVLDASLFEKYSLDRPSTLDDPISFEDVLMRLKNEGRISNAFSELRSLMDLLDAVAMQKAIICQNNKIIDEYNNYINKLPDEMHDVFSNILSDEECLVEIDRGKFTLEEFDEIEGTELGAKEVYLDLASALKKKTVVSTQEDKNNIYIKVSGFRRISRHGILCKNTWEHLKVINSRS